MEHNYIRYSILGLLKHKLWLFSLKKNFQRRGIRTSKLKGFWKMPYWQCPEYGKIAVQFVCLSIEVPRGYHRPLIFEHAKF